MDAQQAPKIRLIEADNPSGPWTRVPDDDVESESLDLDLARMDNADLDRRQPIDDRSGLGNEMLGLARVEMVRKLPGLPLGATMYDLAAWLLQEKGLKLQDLENWTTFFALLRLGSTRPAGGEVKPQPDTAHSEDFHSVRWYGEKYVFTHTQAALVTLLWRAWENGTPDLGKDYLLTQADCEGNRLRDVFRNHPAWEVMIVETGRGVYRLSEPQKES
jgi:hypothetical protein